MAKQEAEISSRQRYWLMLECQFWIFHLFVCAIAIYILAQISMVDIAASDIYTTDNHKYSLEAIDLWKRGYVIDIKAVNTDNCPEGYSSLISYTWPGTRTGCFCETTVQSHTLQYVLEGDCSSELISYGCSTIEQISAKKLKMWKGGKLICYKRAQSLSFYNSTLESLGDGTILKQCASGKSYAAKTLPQVECPVSVVSNASMTSSQQQIQLADASSLFYDNQQNYPIADFKLTQYQFCPYFPQINISPNKKGNYILQVNNYSTTCNGTDPRIVQFDFLNEQEFLTNNTRIYSLIESLPGYPRPSPTYVYRLGYVRYPAWTDQCRKSDTHDLLEATKHLNFSHIGDQTKLLVYVGVPCLLIFALLFRGFYIIRHLFELRAKKEFNMVLLSDEEVVEQIPNLNLIKSTACESMLLLVQILFIAAPLIVFIFCAMLFFDESYWIKDVFLKFCTQQHLQNIFYMYEQLVDTQAFVVARCVMFCTILIVVEVIHFCIRVFHGDLKGKDTKVQDQLSAQELLREDIYQNDKQLKIDDNSQQNINIQDSSNVFLNIDRSEEKVYNLDNIMENEGINGADETNYNFYGGSSIEYQQISAVKKKKKKKGGKRKNLFKDDS